MKQVTIESVKQRIAYIEDLNERGVGTKVQQQQFELACLRELVAVTEQRDAVVLEAAQMRQIIDSITNLDNEPQYHEQGMGCGLEDRNITDRYEAMRHGWDEAMERVYAEVIPCAEELSFPTFDAIRDSLRAEGVEMAAQSDQFSNWVQQGLRHFALCLREDARQLRESKGAQS